MQELIAFNEQRAAIYWWMSTLFSRELTVENIRHYLDEDMQSFLLALTQTPSLEHPTTTFLEALHRLNNRPDAQLELAADFCDLFLTTPKTGALPYASLYLDENGLMNARPAVEMEKWLETYQIAQRKSFNEPADHLAVELDLMGNLIILTNQQASDTESEQAMQAQDTFLTTMLLSWLPEFVSQLNKRDTFGFYAAAASLLLAFCQLDAQFLKGDA
ncbi:molecular chaperone TorD [Photobacterium galatheae]|uniref:molecular chaperone TorD n=1 Tax=Photobacterium galatheae TaxID=1654360 RepID=UPI00202CEACA|nr:molecular chaperone TorD [Photobacterium galatheae]MCM0148829.1 molecular chaperone TorD [Photobacterium galatheae]